MYNSYRDKKEQKPFRKCDHPGCEEAGEYRAPKDRSLTEYYWFCLKHVSEYNKSWNYYDGMSTEEIERENKLDETWHAPSWKFGINLENLAREGRLDDPLEIYNTYMKGRKTTSASSAKSKTLLQTQFTTKEWEAVRFLELSIPYTEAQLKSRYKVLVKKHHPDLNQGSKASEEIFKKVVESYNILLKKISKK